MQKDETLGLDYASSKKLAQGEYPIDFTLDLHGHHMNEAYEALVEAIEFGYASGMRCILVITGKGLHSRDDGGFSHGADYSDRQTLKEQVPQWLGDLRLADKIIKFTDAHKKHGGSGALYVLLRRQRN
jgi:DNA-nicking Smr family endonuclease